MNRILGAEREAPRPISANGLYCAILVVSLLLLAATLFRYQIWELAGPFALLAQLNLTGENNLAAWWSGMVLLLAALLAADGAAALRPDAPRAARGWTILALILVALSADEIASLHERADMLLGWGSWGSLVPFAVMLLSLLAASLVWIASGRCGKRDALQIGIGFACFGAAAGQEALEHGLVWSGWSASARGAFEEGTELAGMIILLDACLRRSAGPAFSAVVRHRRAIGALALVLAPLLAWMTAGLDDPHRGRPADWAAGSLLLVAGLAATPWGARARRFDPAALLLLVLPAVAASIVVVTVRLGLVALPGAPGGPVPLRAIGICGIAGLLIAGWIVKGRARGRAGLVAVVALLGLVLLALRAQDRLLAYGTYQAIGILVLERNTRREAP